MLNSSPAKRFGTQSVVAGLLVTASLLAASCTNALAGERPVRIAIDPAKAGPDYKVQGEYVGELDAGGTVGIQVYAQGDGEFHATAYYGGLPGDGAENVSVVHAEGKTEGNKTTLHSEHGSAVIADGKMQLLDLDGQEIGMLKRVERESPTLGLEPPENAIVLFDGSDTDAFARATMRDKLLMAGTVTKQSFGDCLLHLEFRTPFMPFARGQDRGNSGVYIQNRYEVQVLDSFGLEGKDNECGGLYSFRAPDVHMCFPPLAWQTYDIIFIAARFDEEGNRLTPARLTVEHNGITIHDDVELPEESPGAANQETEHHGPLQLQFHLNPVQYRNIWIVEQGEEDES